MRLFLLTLSEPRLKNHSVSLVKQLKWFVIDKAWSGRENLQL